MEAHFGFQILIARTEVGGYCAHCQVLRTQEVEQVRLDAGARPAAPRRNEERKAAS